ncbi:MAG: prephenate dehydrogenase/arogenate dehydrogenase family protein [Chloroflexota bacterium]|nr:prephenate dehydrogenase/arogenate dehydrogenase family protein [Chloroflexota bacterium]MED5208906.1 prephenate dehydrogenase/arogenate dehydrogenase family protein [Chloroflexota bacterium]MEE2948890.1 prephenate dehydrogenase/arogenate dehydrogenase family protein [Chloroflexota bacterium]
MTTIAIVGTGLIGTSLALAIKQSNLQVDVVGTDYDQSARSGAQKSGAFKKVESNLSNAIRGADVVIYATPVLAMREMMEASVNDFEEGCVVTDVGSSKKVVIEWADEILPESVSFVGGHPMAGKELSGPTNADGDLFKGKAYCIIPSVTAEKSAVSSVTTLAESIGAKPFFIGVDEHDSFVAAASHLPFMMSVALMGTASKSANWEDIAQLASSGFASLSRLASGDPIMHRDICVSNPKPIVAWMDAYIREMYDLRNMLANENGPDPEAVHQVFVDAMEARARWQAGIVTTLDRISGPSTEIPTFAETMGEMFIGRRGMEAQKKLFRSPNDDRANKS